MNKEEIGKTVSNFISKNFLFNQEKQVDDTVSLLGTGIIDSMGTLELISFLESNYNIRFDDEELVAENFDSIEKIKEFLSTKLNHSAA
ncbi:MAG: acyl carrier protein [Bacteroidota bacterium]|nr:acyl carrier protein [Bacteroidota bacterium]